MQKTSISRNSSSCSSQWHSTDGENTEIFTFFYIDENQGKILADAFEVGSKNASRKVKKAPTRENVEVALYKWFKQVQTNDVPIIGPMLLTKANTFVNDLNTEPASTEWIAIYVDTPLFDFNTVIHILILYTLYTRMYIHVCTCTVHYMCGRPTSCICL